MKAGGWRELLGCFSLVSENAFGVGADRHSQILSANGVSSREEIQQATHLYIPPHRFFLVARGLMSCHGQHN